MDQEPDLGDEPLPPPAQEEAEAEAWEHWHQRAHQLEAEARRLRELAKRLSDTLLKLRPLGGSEMVTQSGDEYWADPECFAKVIEHDRESLRCALKDKVLAEREARRLREQRDELLAAVANIVANARIQPDASMGGFTDVYAVPLDDIDAARAAIAKCEAAP